MALPTTGEASVAVWRAHREAGFGVMTPIPYYQNLLVSAARGMPRKAQGEVRAETAARTGWTWSAPCPARNFPIFTKCECLQSSARARGRPRALLAYTRRVAVAQHPQQVLRGHLGTAVVHASAASTRRVGRKTKCPRQSVATSVGTRMALPTTERLLWHCGEKAHCKARNRHLHADSADSLFAKICFFSVARVHDGHMTTCHRNQQIVVTDDFGAAGSVFLEFIRNRAGFRTRLLG